MSDEITNIEMQNDIPVPDQVPPIPYPPVPPMFPPWHHFTPPNYTPFRVHVPHGIRNNSRPNFAWTAEGLSAQEQYYELRTVVMDISNVVNSYGQYVDWIIATGIEQEVLYHMHEYVDPLVQSLNNSIANLQTQITAIDARVDVTEGDITSIKAQISDINSTLTNIDTRLDALETLTASHTQRITELEGDVNTIRNTQATQAGQISGLQTSVSNHETRITANTEKNAQQDGRIQALEDGMSGYATNEALNEVKNLIVPISTTTLPIQSVFTVTSPMWMGLGGTVSTDPITCDIIDYGTKLVCKFKGARVLIPAKPSDSTNVMQLPVGYRFGNGSVVAAQSDQIPYNLVSGATNYSLMGTAVGLYITNGATSIGGSLASLPAGQYVAYISAFELEVFRAF